MKTVIEMAREAGLHRQQHNLMSNPVQHRFSYDGYEENLERFAELVRADERNSWPAEMAAMERQVNILTDALAEQPAPAAQQEPVPTECRRDGRCQYAIDNGIEGLSLGFPQPAPVQGWKLVPAQPTDQMRDAGNIIIGDRGALFAAYQAMIAAAPQAQPARVRNADGTLNVRMPRDVRPIEAAHNTKENQ